MLSTRWKVFRGDSTRRRDLLFTVVKPSVIQLRGSTKVSIFLASNDAEQACDFRITGSYHDGACAVSLGDSDTVIAKASALFPVGQLALLARRVRWLNPEWIGTEFVADRPAVQRGERAAGEEHVQRHRQPGHRLRLHRRARRHPRRDAFPEMTKRLLTFSPRPLQFSCSNVLAFMCALIGLCHFDAIGVLLLHLGFL